jgi:broad specificity phosphatase PhoE
MTAGVSGGNDAAEGHSKASNTQSNKRKVVVVARHAERQDYVMRDRGENFLPSTDRPWDPPLSENGLEQGRNLGKEIRKSLMEHGLSPVMAVYSSPLIRCLQTASTATEGLLTTQESKDDGDVEASGPDEAYRHPEALQVHIEEGLVESINESWYRSWCLPESNGTWGFRPADSQGNPIITVDLETIHEAAKQPIQNLIRFPSKDDSNNLVSKLEHVDLSYQSISRIDEPYCWGSFESRSQQRQRMHSVLELLSSKHEGETILCLSHGGPVTHLYERLTGNHWSQHGESSYACYSIYVQDEGETEWRPLLVNQPTL